MASPALDDNDNNEDPPLDPAIERVRRRLVRFVAINLSLLFLALMAVVVALVYKAGTSSAPTATESSAFLEGEITLPAGAGIVSQSLSGDRLMLELELAEGDRVFLLYDLGEGRLIGRFAVVEE